jgi:CRP-like cAMP-binding protein
MTIDKHFMKLRARDDITPEEEALVRSAVREIVEVPADRAIVRAREQLDYSLLLLSGLAARRNDLRDGKRQFTELHLAGDFVDIHGFTLKYLEHDIVALSKCAFAIIPHSEILKWTEHHPHLARAYWFGTNLDAAISRVWELSLGSRSATARMAHLFCEMHVRLEIVGLVRDGSYDFPVSQQELAEILAMTPVHANRTLQELRRQGLVQFSGGVVTIQDFHRLSQTAEFDPAYLYLQKRPR